MTSYTQMTSVVEVGIVEQVSDIITNISPAETPFQTSIGVEKIYNTLYQWLEDALDPPAANYQAEGASAPAAHLVPVVERNNTTQIFAKSVSVSGTVDSLKLHGRADEFAYQLAKKGKEIKRDLEVALTMSRQTMVTGATRQFAGVQAQFSGASARVQNNILYANSVAGGTSITTLSESIFLQATQIAYNNGRDAEIALIKPSDHQIVSSFVQTSAGGRYRDMEDSKKITNLVDVYVGPFGEQKFVKSRWVAANGDYFSNQYGDAILYDPDMWKLRPLRPWFVKKLAETGDARQSELIGEFGLSHMDFDEGVLITYLT